MIITGKRCSKCGAQRELSEYNNKKASPDGKRSECRICSSLDYDQAKIDGKIKLNPINVGYKTFKRRHGIAYTTIRDWMIREFDKGNLDVWQLKDVPQEDRNKLVAKYKRYKKQKGSYKSGVSK